VISSSEWKIDAATLLLSDRMIAGKQFINKAELCAGDRRGAEISPTLMAALSGRRAHKDRAS